MSDAGPDFHQQDAARADALRRMRWVATGLLLLMAAIYIATSRYLELYPALGYIRAFAEAAMVGACADWFAVTALFRHPLGLPIPHTAIIPRNRARVGEALGGFVAKNFLAPAVVGERLDKIDAAGWIAARLARSDASAIVAARAASIARKALAAIGPEEAHRLLREASRRGVTALPAAPFAARILLVLWDNGHLTQIIERAIVWLSMLLDRHEGTIRALVARHSSSWIPSFIDEKLADTIIKGVRATLMEARAPDHPWRLALGHEIERLIDRLAHDPAMLAAGERLAAQLLESPAFDGYLKRAWVALAEMAEADLAEDNGLFQRKLEQGIDAAARWIETDPSIKATLNGWLRAGILGLLVPQREEIGAFIAGVVARWDSQTLINRLELQVGRDLQYIRINGTIVGGLVGLVIYALSRLAF